MKYWKMSLITMLAVLVATAPSMAESTKIKIVLVGDSTVTDNAGWGLGFKQFLTDGAECINWDFPYGLMPTNGVGGFRDFLPSS